jgi:hypothetical protein
MLAFIAIVLVTSVSWHLNACGGGDAFPKSTLIKLGMNGEGG